MLDQDGVVFKSVCCHATIFPFSPEWLNLAQLMNGEKAKLEEKEEVEMEEEEEVEMEERKPVLFYTGSLLFEVQRDDGSG